MDKMDYQNEIINEEQTQDLVCDEGAEIAEPAETVLEPQQLPKSPSPSRQVMRRFFRSKLSIIGLITIIFLFLFSFIGPFFSPWDEIDPDDTVGSVNYSEVEVALLDKEGKPVLDENGEAKTVWLVTIEQGSINTKDYPSARHLLGTDENGRDVLTRLMYGGRVSLSIGFIVIFAEVLIGTVLGGIAGFFGKWVDQIIMRIVDIFSCVPTLPILLIASVAISSMGIADESRIYFLMITITVFGWPGTARLVRGQILSLRDQDMIVAAESLGFSSARKIFKHLIPNVMPQLIVTMTLGLGSVILYEASLSWLGLGVPYPYATWGAMIKSATDNPDILANYFHIWLPAGLAIVAAVLAFNFIGDGLRDAFDPKGKR